MSWLKIAATKKVYKVGDILKHGTTGQMGVILNDYSSHYVLECAAAPDTPYKRESRSVSHEEASENWKKVGTIKMNSGQPLTHAFVEQMHDKIKWAPEGWLEYGTFKVGSQVRIPSSPDRWTIVAFSQGHKADLVLTADLNSHEPVTPLTVQIEKLAPWQKRSIEVGASITDSYYGQGKVADASDFEETGAVDVVFEDLFRVRNYQVPKNQLTVQASTEDASVLVVQCPIDNSYHTPFCAIHIEALLEEASLEKKANLIKTAALQVEKVAASQIEEVRRHLAALQPYLSVNMFAPDLYKSAVRNVPVENIGEDDILHLSSSVVHASTGRKGIIIAADLKDWSVKVRWEDDTVGRYWRQELLSPRNA